MAHYDFIVPIIERLCMLGASSGMRTKAFSNFKDKYVDSPYIVESVEIDEREKRYHQYFTSVQSAIKKAYPDKNKLLTNVKICANEDFWRHQGREFSKIITGKTEDVLEYIKLKNYMLSCWAI